MGKGNVEDFYPLSPMQQGMLFHTIYSPNSGVYFEQLTCTLRKLASAQAFKQAWQQVTDRHPILRTSFVWEGVKEPVQVVYRQVQLPWEECDWQGLAPAAQQQQLETFLKSDRERGFDMRQPPLMRMTLIELAKDTYYFIWSHHHLLLDGWSNPAILTEVFDFYQAELNGEQLSLPRPRPYRDYIVWIQQQNLSEAESFWRQRLQGFTAPTPMPIERDFGSAAPEESDREQQILLSVATTAALRSLARQQQLTLNTLVQGAWGLLLSRYSGEEDVIFGTVVSGRPPDLAGVESMVGLFVNTQPARVKIRPKDSLLSWLKQLQDRQIEARQYEYSPLVEVQRWSEVPRGLPLFDTLVVFENYPLESSLQKRVQNLEIESVISFEKTNYALTLTVVPGEELALKISYNSNRFEDAAIPFGIASLHARMLGHLQVLLEGIAANPHQPLKNLPLLTPAEKQQTLVEWNGTKAEYPQDRCIHQLFEQQAERTPDAVAVVFEDQKLTYRELNERANQLAHYLQQLGVKSEVLVGICVERSLLTIVGILGILKAGGAYVPLAPANPIDRTAFILQDASVSVLLTQETLLETLPSYSCQVVCLDANCPAIAQNSTDNPNSHATAENLAYVIYTSGSTGQPKGVLVTHANVVRLFAATQSWYNFSEGDVWTLFHSYAFDFSVWELWGALIYGGRLVIVPYFVARSPIAFYELLCRERVTVLNQTPSAFRQLMQAEESVQTGNNLSLRWVIFGGEALELPSLKPWFERHGDRSPQLVNMYGITETTVHVTYRPLSLADLNGQGSVIGCAIPDLQLYILDKNRQLVPVGIPGEMYVGGAGVARGYLNRPDLTAERFISNPFSEKKEARLYKTGDLARYLPNGDIEYLGRIDTQVKVRGFRIELGEIEAQLNRHPAVRESVVLLREDAPGDKRLIAYIVANSETTLTTGELHVFLKEKLPDYMVPAAFVLLEALPLTINGKVDRRALPEPDTARADLAFDFVAPQTAEEKALAEIWEKILGVEKVGIRDNFFALGGDSIRSIQVQSLAQKQGLRFSLQQLFQSPTIEAIVRELKATEFKDLQPSKSQAFSLILPADKEQIPDNVEDAYPLTALQMGMIFHSEYSQESAIYHDIFSFHLKAPLEIQVLQAAIEYLVKRHPVLRTSFQLTGFSEPLQLVHQKVEIPLQVEDLRHLSNSEREAALNAWFEGERNRHFDWKTPPLMQFQIHRYTQETFQLTFAFHHAILDGWSVGLLLTELFQQYFLLLGKTGGSAAVLPQSAFRDFVALERASVASEEHQRFWKEKLSDCTIAVLPRWQKFPREARIRQICTHKVAIPPEISEGLKQLANWAGVPLKSVLLAAHLRVLSLLCGQSDVLAGLVANGRPEETDGERICGLFLNTLPFRLQLSGGTWIDLVQQVFEAERELLPYRRYPLAEIQRNFGGQPLFETAFNYVNFHVYQGVQTLTNLEVLGGKFLEETNFPLLVQFSLEPFSGKVQLSLEYDSAEFGGEQVEAMEGYYARTLEAIARESSERYELRSLLSEREQHQLLIKWNDTRADYPQDRCIHQLFEQQAERTPDAVAVVFEDQKLTYRELNERANKLAHYLQQLGVQPEVLVGICVERSLEAIVGLLGILKAGGAYVPLDPTYPKERLSFMLEETQVSVLLTQAHLAESLPAHQAHLICLDSDWEIIAQHGEENPAPLVTSSNLAYIMYTSGSTGKPKGASVTQRGVVRLVKGSNYANLSAEEVFLQLAPISFDAATFEIWGSLLNGARLVVMPAHTPSLQELGRAIRQNQITTLWLTAGLFHLMVDEQLEDLKQVQQLLAGGDILSVSHVLKLLREAKGCRLINGYGPTENTKFTCCYSITDASQIVNSVSIGCPISNTQVYILDSQLQPVPIGVPGELYIAGDGLARGYFNRPELTARAFISNPFSDEPDARLYKTGDLARYLPDGNIEYLGRIDNQVKIRGYRIELGEIEETLRQHPAVQDAAAIARDDGSGNKGLVAYVVLDPDKLPSISNLRGYLQEKLPEYMVPSAFVTLESLPLTPNGKLDRRALPQKCDRVSEETAFTEPQTPTEKELAQIWMAVLELEKVGTNEIFFDIGGHSLMAMQLVSRVRMRFGVELPLYDFYAAPTIQNLAELVEEEILANADSNQIDELLDSLEKFDGEESQSVIVNE